MTRARIATVLTLLASGAFGAFAFAVDAWPYGAALRLARATGWVGVVAFVLTLATTPLSRLGPRSAFLRSWRRPLGIASAAAAIAHLGMALTGPLAGAWSAVLWWPNFRSGLLALGILLVLLATSFPRLVRALNLRHWKPLHRLSYFVVVLLAHHLLTGRFGSVFAFAFLCAAMTALLLARIPVVLLQRRRHAQARAVQRGETHDGSPSLDLDGDV